ncbi:MAG: hypothetical protein MPW16_02015 [Candidatus Manganitrophus sp.]|nr:MAG: hypothetical protein MPW16_02015 [Candidatus Manganitrophus sp.]
MQNTEYVSPEFARQLILDELFDLSLYKRFREISGPELHPTLDELIKVENGHLGFWQELFKVEISELNFARRLKLEMIVLVCRLFGAPAIDLILDRPDPGGDRGLRHPEIPDPLETEQGQPDGKSGSRDLER